MMREFWNARAPRERLILQLGGFVAAIILLWGYGWVPTQKARVRLQQDITTAQSDLQFMREAASVLAPRKSSLPSVQLNRSGKTVLSLVDASLRARGLELALKKIEPIGEGRVEVMFEQVRFDDLMAWLEAVHASDGIVADDLTITRVEGVGVVNARLGILDPMGVR